MKNKKNSREHWHRPFFRFRWDEGMSRLPMKENCPECGQQQEQDTNRASVFRRLGLQHGGSSRPAARDESDSEDDKYHRPRWCPDGLSRTQKRKVQRVRSLEEAEERFLMRRRGCRDQDTGACRPGREERCAPKREWHPKTNKGPKEDIQKKVDARPSAPINMVFILPPEYHAPRSEEAAIA